MFKSTEKAALQEIGPRFTLKLRWLKKGIPTERGLRSALSAHRASADPSNAGAPEPPHDAIPVSSSGLKDEEYEWQWDVCDLGQFLGTTTDAKPTVGYKATVSAAFFSVRVFRCNAPQHSTSISLWFYSYTWATRTIPSYVPTHLMVREPSC